MNKQDWMDYQNYLESLVVPVKQTLRMTNENFVKMVNNTNIKREVWILSKKQ